MLLTTAATVAAAVLFNQVYRSIGRRVDALRGDVVGVVLRTDCRIAAAHVESPGIAEIREDGTLVLRPITGDKIVLPLAHLSHQESRWFNGERLWGEARAFALSGADAPPVVLAVESAGAWREQFARSHRTRPSVVEPASA